MGSVQLLKDLPFIKDVSVEVHLFLAIYKGSSSKRAKRSKIETPQMGLVCIPRVALLPVELFCSKGEVN